MPTYFAQRPQVVRVVPDSQLNFFMARSRDTCSAAPWSPAGRRCWPLACPRVGLADIDRRWCLAGQREDCARKHRKARAAQRCGGGCVLLYSTPIHLFRKIQFKLDYPLLVYQSVLLHGLVRLLEISNNYLSHALFNQLNILIQYCKDTYLSLCNYNKCDRFIY